MKGTKQPISLAIAIGNLPPDEHITAPRKTLFINNWTDTIEYTIEEPKHFDSIGDKPIPRRGERKSYIRRKK